MVMTCNSTWMGSELQFAAILLEGGGRRDIPPNSAEVLATTPSRLVRQGDNQ